MFGGGRGQLILEDPENPLTCGIEIRVQPPGKQVKTITLLSGGEKRMRGGWKTTHCLWR